MPLLARHGPDLPLHWRGCEGQGHCEDPAQLRPGLRLVRGGGVSGPGSSSSYKGGQKMIPLLRPNVLHWAATHGEGDRFSYYDDDQDCGNDLHVWRWSGCMVVRDLVVNFRDRGVAAKECSNDAYISADILIDQALASNSGGTPKDLVKAVWDGNECECDN